MNGLAPFTAPFHSAWNALPAGPPAAEAAVPLRPTTGLPDPVERLHVPSASVISVFDALHWPLRTSAGANFWNVSGKSMITQPAGRPDTSFCASVSNVGWAGFHEIVHADLPAELLELRTNSCLSAVPKASLRAPTLTVAPLPNFADRGLGEDLALQVSDGYARQT